MYKYPVHIQSTNDVVPRVSLCGAPISLYKAVLSYEVASDSWIWEEMYDWREISNTELRDECLLLAFSDISTVFKWTDNVHKPAELPEQ